MRVVHLINGLGTGGGEHLLAAVVEQLPEHQPTVYCLTRLGAVAERLRQRGVAVRRLTWRGMPSPVGWVQLLVDLRRADVLHSHFFYSDLVASVLGRLLQVRLRVSTRHETGYWMRRWHRWLEPRVYAGLHRVVCVSGAVQRALEERGIEPGALVVVHPGIEPVVRAPDNPRELVVASVGRLEHVKGHDVLLRAFATARGLQGWRLAIAGDGKERSALERLAADLGVAHCCELLGEQPTSTVRALLLRASLFVLPSRSEAFGLALVEAMAAGCACIASCVGGVPEVARHERDAWLVPAGDVEALAAALERLAADRRLRESLAAAGTDRVRELGIDNYVRRVEAVYTGDEVPSISNVTRLD